MAVRFFSLHDVPEDEAEEVKALLNGAGIEFYETPAGNWGISTPAIWLRDVARQGEARALLDAYQVQRAQRMHAEYERQVANGTQRTLLDVIRDNPLRFVVYVTVILTIAYFSTVPFIDLGR